ncbi:MAG: asparagine synthetase B [Candidatus Pacebacteria bacterium]|nr:asparagine synthetase B [Candidatus Paceibacterota bacterium]
MCGIIGFVGKNQINKIFRANYESIKNRGVFFHSQIHSNEAYGYIRLPTDAVKNTELNTIGENKDRLLYNGLLTNISDLNRIFSLKSAARHSDTVTLHCGFKQYGKYFLEQCRGMFAFAYVNKNTITLARDTIGIKPLYYIYDKELFGFCSEIKGLLNCNNAKIYELLPGEILSYNRKLHQIRKDSFIYKPLKHAETDIQKCLEESLVPSAKRYLQQSEKNIALLISGGLDSSIILQILYNNLSKTYRKRIITFCTGNTHSSDILIAKRLTNLLGFQLVKVPPYTSAQANLILSKMVYKAESCFSRVIRVALLQDALAKSIQKMNINVVLSGEGADELFFGYPRFIDGMLPNEIRDSFHLFFKTVFPSTLLQRYDRVFAQKQIEGRVPFLDQELVVLAQQYKTSELIGIFEGKQFSKIPLRQLAKSIGLPPYIYLRKKTTMTRGATNKDNHEDGQFQCLVNQYYKEQFNNNRINSDIKTRADETTIISNKKHLNHNMLHH